MNQDVLNYNHSLSAKEKEICDTLFEIISETLIDAENKIWHAHPVWFLNENPIVGYSKLKTGIRLLFWSGESFNEPLLKAGSGKFKDASITYTDISQINTDYLKRWLEKSRSIQWDYKNVVKRKGILERLI